MKRNRPCLRCGRYTQAKAQIHPTCTEGPPIVEEVDGLPLGRWVPNGRGIVVWRGRDGLAMREGAA